MAALRVSVFCVEESKRRLTVFPSSSACFRSSHVKVKSRRILHSFSSYASSRPRRCPLHMLAAIEKYQFALVTADYRFAPQVGIKFTRMFRPAFYSRAVLQSSCDSTVTRSNAPLSSCHGLRIHRRLSLTWHLSPTHTCEDQSGDRSVAPQSSV